MSPSLRLAALVSVVAVVFYLVVGHTAHAETKPIGMHEAGICLLLATAVGGSLLLLKRRLLPLTPPLRSPRSRLQPTPFTALSLRQMPRATGRASPVWLQRFLR